MGSTRGASLDGIALLDGLYELALQPGLDWAPAVFEVVRPHIDAGLGALAYEFDLRVHGYWISPVDRMIGDPDLARTVRSAFDHVGAHMRASLRPGPVLTINRMIGAPICDSPLFASFAQQWGAYDFMGVLSVDSDGRGMMVSAPLPQGKPLSPGRRRQWTMLARHLSAATRLHRAISRTGLVPSAQIDVSGRTDMLGADPRRAMRFRASAQRIRQARRRREAGLAEQAISMWQVLSSGNWSLVRGVDSARTLFAYENPPNAPDPRRLSRRERVIAHLAGFGHSNKLIAYELGCAESTVSNILTRIRRKLCLRSRAALVNFVTELASTPAERIEVCGTRIAVATKNERREIVEPRLTAAERAVADLAARGLSNAAIAVERGASPHTIANQLASIYEKLQVRSRAELTAVIHRICGRE